MEESKTVNISLYNYGSCFFTSKLYHMIDGMEDDFSGDRFEIESTVVSYNKLWADSYKTLILCFFFFIISIILPKIIMGNSLNILFFLA